MLTHMGTPTYTQIRKDPQGFKCPSVWLLTHCWGAVSVLGCVKNKAADFGVEMARFYWQFSGAGPKSSNTAASKFSSCGLLNHNIPQRREIFNTPKLHFPFISFLS